MSFHDLLTKKLQVGRILNKLASYIIVANELRYSSADIDTTHPQSLVMRQDIETVRREIRLWDGEPTHEGEYVTHPIGDIEYLFRSLVDNNVSEPTLEGGGGLLAWEDSGETGFPNEYNDIYSYFAGNIAWEYHPDFPGDNTKIVAFRSSQDGNFDHPLDFDNDTEWWEQLGPFKTPYIFVSGTTYALGEVVVDDTDGDRIYISNIADNDLALDAIIPGSATWKVIGAPGGGSSGTPTSGTLLSSDSPLVITWDTDLVPDDEEGRTYLEKHGPLEKVSIQVTMPDPTAPDPDDDPLMTVFPSWRFDENTKNILTIDNQGQKLYYVIGFGADGSSSGGGITLTTEGTSGAATLEGSVLNIPVYTSGGGGGLELGETSSTAYRGDRGKTAYDHSQSTGNPHGTTIAQISGLQAELDSKVEEEAGMGLSENSYTDAEKTKLSNLNDYFVGTYASYGALVAAHPTGSPGQYAVVDTIVSNARIYIWDNDNNDWVQGNQSAVTSVNGQIGAVSLDQDDIGDGTTNKAYTATEKTKLAGVAAGATANQADAYLLARGNHTGAQAISTVTGLQTALDDKAPIASPAFTGTPAAPTASLGTNTTQLATMAALYQGVTQLQGINTQTASYTLVLADAGKLVQMNVASGNNLTIPLNSSVAFPINTQLVIRQIGAGQTTIVATSGVTIQSSGGKLKLTGQYSGGTLVKVATDTWALMGDIAS